MRRAAALLCSFLLLAAGCGGGDDDRAGEKREERRPSGVEVRAFEVRSEAVGRTLPARVLAPRDRAPGAPLLVLLHGQGMSPDGMISDELRAELARGDDAPVVLLPYGDEASYWHDREGGDWGRMVVEEAIPQAVEQFGADRRRVSVAGVSMGGFGALHLALAYPERFCAVSAHSPAVFVKRPRGGSPFAEAFDDRADFERVDPIARAASLPAGTWVDIGNQDPFTPAVRRLVDRMREPRFRLWNGGHDFTFWQERTAEWLRFHRERC